MNNMYENIDSSDVFEFIARRFKQNCDWTTGNCFYFATILKCRFGGDIYYDVVQGHFVLKFKDKYYDWNGIYNEYSTGSLIKWDDFDDYDSALKERIIVDCIM